MTKTSRTRTHQRTPTRRTPYVVGKYQHHTQCRFCSSTRLQTVIDFGYVPLAGGFLKPGTTAYQFAHEKRYPLPIKFCEDCYLIQVVDVVGGKKLFDDYFYHSSAIGTLVGHFTEYSKEIAELYDKPEDVFVVELGCNDGVFLKPLMKHGFKVHGVDPATNIVQPMIKQGMPITNDFFTKKVAKNIVKQHGQAEVILSSNSFAHIDNMHDVMAGVDELLSPTGFLAFEVHYLGTLIKEVQYDMMYHEHMSYYSLLALQNFFAQYDMEVFDVKPIPIHAGSMRYYVQRVGSGGRERTVEAKKLQQLELCQKLDTVEAYLDFGKSVAKTKTDLLELLAKLKADGKTIAGYGASGRATAVSAYCELTKDHLEYVIDDAPAKQGSFTPGNHLPIVDSSILDDPEKRPDYCLVFAWSFINEIKKRQTNYLESGGQFIVPLPEVGVV